MKQFLCIITCLVALIVSARAGEEGVWGGKWDDTWPVFLKVERGSNPGTYKVQYIWLETIGDTDYGKQSGIGKKIGDHFEAGNLFFKLDGTTGLLYGRFDSPRMATLVKIDSGLPTPVESDDALRKSGWKSGGRISPPDALKKIKGE